MSYQELINRVMITFSSQPNHLLSCQPCNHSSAQ